jgi:hypothetical protein
MKRILALLLLVSSVHTFVAISFAAETSTNAPAATRSRFFPDRVGTAGG